MKQIYKEMEVYFEKKSLGIKNLKNKVEYIFNNINVKFYIFFVKSNNYIYFC